MAKDPAFLFYSSDFLNGVADLTMDERGQFITLLCLQHQKGAVTDKTIRLSLGSVSVDVLNKFVKDKQGNFFNERLKEEIEKRIQFTESRRNNGSKGGRPKNNTKPSGKPTNNLMEDVNENEDENIIDNKNEEFGKSENLLNGKELIPSLCRIWYNKFTSYAKDQEQDFKAVGEILKFMVRQHAITDINAARSQIEATFTQVADFVSKDKFWKNKPLKTIANNIQEFYNKIKNGTDDKQQFRSDLQAAFNERYK